MPNFYTRLFARICVFQAGRRPELDYLKETGAGNILDLPSRHVMSTELGAESVETVGSSDGTQIPTSRSHVAEIPITEEEVGRLAELMNRVGCYCQFIALGLPGTKNLRWAEPSRMTVADRANGPLQYAPKVLRFECDVFHPNIVQSQNLIEQVPFEGADSRAKNVREVDKWTMEQGTNNAYGFQNTDGFFYSYEPFTFGSFQKPDNITYYNEDLFYQEAQGSVLGGDSVITVANNFLVGDLRKSDGVFDPYFETSYIHQGIAVIASGNGTRAGNLLFWIPGDGQIFETDDSGNVAQKWTISEFSQVTSLSYEFNGVSDERGVLVLDTDGTVWSLSLDPNADSYSVSDSYTPTNPFSISSKTGWNYFTVVQNDDIFPSDPTKTDVRDNDIDRYDSTDGSLVETTDLQQYVLRQRGVGERRGYEGERFSTPNENVEVDISGNVANLDTGSGEELVTEIIYPFPYTTIELDDTVGVLEAYDWQNTLIGSAPVSADPSEDPIITVDGDLASREGFERSIWKLRLRVQETTGSPKLRVVDPQSNRSLGARPGGWVDDCIDRVASPDWTPVALTFEVDVTDTTEEIQVYFEDLQGDPASKTSIDWGDGTTSSPAHERHTYNTTGTYKVVVFASPDFTNIPEVRVNGSANNPILSDTVSFGDLPDVKRIEWRRIANITSDSVSPDNTEEFIVNGFDSGQNGTVDFSIIEDKVRYFFIEGSNSNPGEVLTDGTLGQLPDDLEEFIVKDCRRGTETEFQQGDLSGNKLIAYKTSFTAGNFDTTFEALSDHTQLETYESRDGGTVEGDRYNFFEICRSLVTYDDRANGQITSGGLDGQLSNGDPVMPPNMENIQALSYREQGFTDFRNADNLTQYTFAEISGNSLNITEVIRGMIDIIQGNTTTRNPTGDQISLVNMLFQHGVSFDHNHSGLGYHYLVNVWNDLINLADRPDIVLQRRSIPGNIVSIDDTNDTITVNDTNADIYDFYVDAHDAWVNRGYNNEPQFAVMSVSGIPDSNLGRTLDHTKTSGDYSGASHDGVNGETTFNFTSGAVPSGIPSGDGTSTGWVKGDSSVTLNT